MGEGVSCMVYGNQTCGGDHSVVYTDVKLQCCTTETYLKKKTGLGQITQK